MGLSLAERFAYLPEEERREWVLSQPFDVLQEVAREEWWWTARPEQIPPNGDWALCLILAGRGFGKSRLASEWLVQRAIDHPYDRQGFPTEWLMIAQTLSDARTISIEGPSGVLRVLDRRQIPYTYVRHPKPTIVFTDTGSRIYFLGADSPDVGRGYNAAGAVLDELAKWRRAKESWYEGIMPSLRADLIDDHPRTLITTTPKPIELLREWVGRTDGTVTLIRGSTFDNAANLSHYTLQELERRYAGTLIGRQELHGELLDARDGSIWNFADIDLNRLESVDEILFTHITVGVDPTLTDEGDEMGVVVVGRDARNHMYVLADESIPAAGRVAYKHVWQVYFRWGADTVVYEDNMGKKLMKEALTDTFMEMRDQDLMFPQSAKPPMKSTDSRINKRLRAEPVALRYEQNTVHHHGTFSQLEEEMLNFDPTDTHSSPNRMDALVHACRHLMAGERKHMRAAMPSSMWINTR
jgi:phage terminase large subunit-like protein